MRVEGSDAGDMNAWTAHAVLAAILVGSLAARERTAQTPISSDGFESVVSRVAHSQGMHIRATRRESRTLVFDAPGCSKPVFVVVRPATFEDEATIEFASGPGYLRRYFYIDQKWDNPDPRAVLVQRVKYGLLSTFRLTEYAPSDLILQVDAPEDCEAVGTIDWRSAWNRNYFTTAKP
jgi:hypothetical protein